jgi:type II secretory pathway component PulF
LNRLTNMDKNINSIRLKSGEKIALISNLSTMLSAGIPILDAVSSLIEDAKGNQQKILDTLRDDITQGHQVNYTLAKFPNVFDKVTVSIVRASEAAGTLDVTLKDLREGLRKQNEFSDKIKSALLYPTFIVSVFILILLINLIFVIPRVAMVFKSLRVPLPLPTRILIFASDLMVKNTLPFLVGVGIFVLFIIYLFSQKRSMLLNILYSLPGISKLIVLIDVTQFSRSLHLLLNSGLSIVGALELTENVALKKQTKAIIQKSKEMILGGKTFSEGLKAAKGYFPGMMIKLIETGEKTGTLDKSLNDIAEYFDYEVTNTLKTLTALLEPVMLVLVGVVVGIMMIAIISPIYGMISQVGSVR